MPITLTCPQCSRRHNAPETLAGRQARCACGTVLSVPAPVPAAAKPAFAARPSGAWQSPVAAPSAPVAAGPSVFDEISPADLGRSRKPAVAPAAVLDDPVLSPGGSITNEFIERAQRDMAERAKTNYEKLPHGVSLVIAGLGVPGCMTLAAGFGALLLLGTEMAEDYGSEFLIFIFVASVIFAGLDITTAALIYLRVPFSRPLGYFAAIVTLCVGCANPVCFIGAAIALWFLSMPETTEYLSRKGAPGVIDW